MRRKRSSNCRTTAEAPAGWAVVYPTIRIKGERELTREVREAIKQKVREKTPPFHICGGCLFGAWEIRVDRLLGAPAEAAAGVRS